MSTSLLLVALGVAVVVLAILWFRLPAFLALILAAFTVAACTPQPAREQYYLGRSAWRLLSETESGRPLVAATAKQLETGEKVIVLQRDAAGSLSVVGSGEVLRHISLRSGAQGAMLQPTESWPAGKDLIVVTPDALRKARSSAAASVGSRVATGFGEACGSIGLIIAMASLIGTCLLESGAADRIVRTALGWLGEGAAPLAFAGSGFLLGIPVFFDTVFLLMIPLGKALHVRTGRNYLLYVMTMICGATMAHSLVPPTPGPLAVGEALNVNLGTMILAGTVVGLGASTVGLIYACWMNQRNTLPMREASSSVKDQLLANLQRPATELPALWLSVAPILLPVLLITGKSIIEQYPEDLWRNNGLAGLVQVLNVLGDSNICITLAALLALATLVLQHRKSWSELAPALRSSLASAGEIILVTAAGGAFGLTLRQTGIAGLIDELPNTSPVFLCTATFLITVGIRAAQGSATVAMMTAAGIVSGLAQEGELGCHPVYLALAIGCGSKPGMWMNDSGFLVITRMTGMTDAEGLKYVSSLLTLMGLVGLGIILLGAAFWPTLGG